MSNASTILHKRSLVSGVVPALTSLSAGELAMNVADGKLFFKSTSNSVKTFSDDSQVGFILNPVLSGVSPQYGGNTISQSFANVLGGYNNDVSGGGSTTVNGEDNDIAGDYAFIGSGYKNKITANGDYSAILGGSNNLISHPNSFAIGSNLSSHSADFTYVNNISARGSINGQINASDIVTGTLSAARLPSFTGDITTTVNGSVSAKVVAIQGEPISTQTPSNGQFLQWTGTSWTPGSIPTGGSGGGGISYYFNFDTDAQSPTTNLSATPNTPKELGIVSKTASSSYASGDISETNYDLICGFVSLTGVPNTTIIPAGLWDFNIWASSTASNANQMALRLYVYKYDGVNYPTLLSESDDINIYDPIVPAQYIASVVFPQTTISITDRIYIEIRAKSSANKKHVTIYFGGSTPTHVHTTIPSVAGSGLVKIINGVYQNLASLLVNTDVAANAEIDQSKINGLTDVASKSNSTYTTVQTASATWDTAYNIATAYKAVSSTFLTSETDSQTLSFNDVNKNLSISNGNTISLSALVDSSMDTGVRSLTGEWEDTSTIVQNNSASWGSTASGTLTYELSVVDTTQGLYKNGDLIPVGTSIENILINMLKTSVPPTYTSPTLSVAYGSPTVVTTYEVGDTISSFTITPTFNANDSGGSTGFVYFKDASNLGTGSSKVVSSFQINSSTTLQVSAGYSQGAIKNDNLGNPYPTGRINAGSTTSTATLNVLYPYFWGKSNTLPTAASIASDIQNGLANKVLASASGTVSVTYNASGEYIWFAHTAAQTEKTKWYVTALNSGSIGNGQAINSPATQNVTSPDAYWSGVSFKIYISSGQQATTGAFEYRNS